MRKLLILLFCLTVHGMARGQTNIYEYRYWFDNDIVSAIQGTSATANWHLDIPVEGLSDKIHLLHMQIKDTTGVWSTPVTRLFSKLPHAEGMDYLFCMMNIDGKPFRMERLPMSGGAASWVIDTDSLVTGIHRYTIMAITPTGYATSIREGFFVRENMASQLANQHCCYQVDGGEAVVVDGTVNGDQYHFDLDMTDIANGLHKLTYWMVSDNGATTEIHTSLFIKIPLGGTGVKAYDYWLNDDFDNRHTTTLSKVQDPFKLITLLPVESVPLRSSNFKFAFKGEQPIVYAQNDFHIRFLDAGDRYVETTKQFVDEKVWQEVKPVEEIKERQTFDRIEENGIRWFSLKAEIGDTVSFKCDKACTLQLFSPSGKEEYKASGLTSVSFGGCHTKEQGTYYLAVHDVTGSGSTQELLYKHLDKYAVVSYSPNVVGNAEGNSFTIHLIGNGFDKMTHAFITHKNGSSIKGLIGRTTSSDALINFMIDSVGYVNGNYNIKLCYEDQEEKDCLIIVDALLFEEPDYGKIVVSKIGAPSPSNVFIETIKVTNNGNISYSYIPFNIAWDNPHLVRNVKFVNFYASVAAELDSAGYSIVSGTENLLDKGVEGVMMFFYIPHLNPHETMEFQLSIGVNSAGERFNLYAWTGTPVELDSQSGMQYAKSHPHKAFYANYSNRGHNMVTWGDNMANYSGLPGMPRIVSYAGNVGNTAIKTGATIGSYVNATGRRVGNEYINAYGLTGDEADFIRDVYDHQYPEMLSPGSIWGGFLGDLMDRLMGNQDDCAQNPTPSPGDPHSLGWLRSADPNEIYGQRSLSGSIYINDSLKTLNYRIQFENDSTIATAAAQTVIVRDTLGSQYYDLSTFSPTFVKIAENMYELDGSPNFVKTIDMRPKINTIVQVNGDIDKEQGIVTWTFRSLDPMTMEPVTDITKGFLPVNYDGISGIGEVSFCIDLKQPLPNGTEIPNRAGIVFDTNEEIMTQTWINIIDAVAPTSVVDSYEVVNDSTATLYFHGDDNLSGIWKYDVYVIYGEGSAPFKFKEGVSGNQCDVRIYNGMTHGFYVVATDSAGNVEKKTLPEIVVSIGVLPGDANCDGTIDISDVLTVVDAILGKSLRMYCQANADVNEDSVVDISDVLTIVDIILGKTEVSSHSNARMTIDSHLAVKTKGKRCSLLLEGNGHYIGCQMMLKLPEKCLLRGIVPCGERNKGINVDFRHLGHGFYNIVTYSTNGAELVDVNGTLLDLIIDGDYEKDLSVSNILFTNEFLESVSINDLTTSTTGIIPTLDEYLDGDIYSIQGVKVRHPNRGVNIYEGKKTVTR